MSRWFRQINRALAAQARRDERLGLAVAIEPSVAVKALTHPTRLRVLTILEQRTASASDVAREINEPLNAVSHHVRALRRAGLVEQVEKVERGAVFETRYRAAVETHIGDDVWEQVPRAVKGRLLRLLLRDIAKRVNHAAATGAFHRSDAHLTSETLVLDKQGVRELAQAMAAILGRIDEIRAQSAQRHKSDKTERAEMSVILMAFPRHAQARPGKRGRAATAKPDRRKPATKPPGRPTHQKPPANSAGQRITRTSGRPPQQPRPRSGWRDVR